MKAYSRSSRLLQWRKVISLDVTTHLNLLTHSKGIEINMKRTICYGTVGQNVSPGCLKYNPFPNKDLFLRVRSASLLKTLWEKEILLVIPKQALVFTCLQC